MSEIFQTIGSALSSTAGQGILKAGTIGGGFLQNWLANREAQQKQKFVEQLVTDPNKWNAFVAGKTQPLQAGLTQDVSRIADAYGAERGFGSSPAIMKDVYAQALAPYLQAQRQAGENAAENALSIYEDSPTTKPIDITSLLKMFLTNQPGGTSPGGAIRAAAIPPGGIPTIPSQLPDYIPTQDTTAVAGTQSPPFDVGNLVDMGSFS